MKNKNVLIYLSSLVLSSLGAQKTFASDDSQSLFSNENNFSDVEKNKINEEKKLIDNIKKSLAVEESFVQGGVNYVIYKGLKASSGRDSINDFSNDQESGAKTLDLNVNAPKTVLLDKGVFKIFYESKDSKKVKGNYLNDRVVTSKNENNQTKLTDNSNDNFKVAFNNKTKKFAVITGNLIIKIDPEASKVKLPNASYKIVKAYKKLGLYVVKYPETMQIKEAIDKLKIINPAGITVDGDRKNIVNVEVLENFKKPM